ncbi:MAG: bifunctional DNA-formamidopyrimidine glycosylase/DNA-(apurinic or apyrimidinic site) lyase [Deltaproteobacteria bacterium]|jgi:formamidopyrimidine-DNA glycosylase|nr:bifunctional DNA-formamidopyrimidine glycosylase/DNA-(apurinic or apyrimidinic site) lyase [Deltaproteobacteria bacterium]
MPELPEAVTMATDLNALLSGQTIEDVLVNYDPIVASDKLAFGPLLIGQKVDSVNNMGKWVRFCLNSGGAMLAHLKMTGQFILGPWPGSKTGTWPAHAHAAFNFGQKEALFYRDTRKFGRLRAFSDVGLKEFLLELDLGPDANKLGPEEFFQRLLRKPKGKLKQILLDQSVVAGFGNIYCDEALFAASISPHRSISEITRDQAYTLHAETQRILNEAILLKGSTVRSYQSLGEDGTYQSQHKVYGKAGQPCPRCQTPLVRSSIGGRTTVSCINCQK